MTKSFRGKLASGTSEIIRLSTNNGLTGYKIKKLQCITDNPTAYDVEGVVQVFTVETAITSVIDFNNPTLIAAGYFTFGNQPYEVTNAISIFDNVKFNQDIYITYVDNGGSSRPMNYHIELEQVKLSLDEATVATLKDMRGRYTNQDPS
tara:strand:- start:69 stop:515 length:447 start_codon:yes stop_codon:yes gene_type:complete